MVQFNYNLTFKCYHAAKWVKLLWLSWFVFFYLLLI